VPEIERKFKVETLPEDLLGPGSEIRQGYLSVEPVEIRLRARDDARELTVKSLGGLRRVEVALPLTPEQFDEFARDTVNFLQYVSDPAQLERQSLGIWVVLFLLMFTGIAYMLKTEYWKDVR